MNMLYSASVEMESTRLRELTHCSFAFVFFPSTVEMSDTRLRELTHFSCYFVYFSEDFVEMETTRLRELTHLEILLNLFLLGKGRNERYPLEGIDTSKYKHITIIIAIVEMNDTRLRELTPYHFFWVRVLNFWVEMNNTRLRELTPFSPIRTMSLSITCRKGEYPIKGIKTRKTHNRSSVMIGCEFFVCILFSFSFCDLKASECKSV